MVRRAAPSVALRALFAVPLIGAAGVALTVWTGWGVAYALVFAALTGALWRGVMLRYTALVVALVVWVVLAGVVAGRVGAAGWLAPAAFVIFAVFVLACALRLGGYWGRERYEALQASGRGIREWQWVYVGPEPARGLVPHANPNWPIHLTSGLVMAQTLAAIVTAFLSSASVWLSAALLAGAVFGVLTVWALWTRSPAAYPMVILMLLFSLPLSIPLLWYWVEGRRPNLIYRHRFERLVPREGASHV